MLVSVPHKDEETAKQKIQNSNLFCFHCCFRKATVLTIFFLINFISKDSLRKHLWVLYYVKMLSLPPRHYPKLSKSSGMLAISSIFCYFFVIMRTRSQDESILFLILVKGSP